MLRTWTLLATRCRIRNGNLSVLCFSIIHFMEHQGKKKYDQELNSVAKNKKKLEFYNFLFLNSLNGKTELINVRHFDWCVTALAHLRRWFANRQNTRRRSQLCSLFAFTNKWSPLYCLFSTLETPATTVGRALRLQHLACAAMLRFNR